MLVSQTDFFQQIDNLTKEAPTEHVRFIAHRSWPHYEEMTPQNVDVVKFTKTYENKRPPRRVTVIENVYVLAGEPLRSGRPPSGQSALHAGVGGVEASAILSSDS